MSNCAVRKTNTDQQALEENPHAHVMFKSRTQVLKKSIQTRKVTGINGAFTHPDTPTNLNTHIHIPTPRHAQSMLTRSQKSTTSDGQRQRKVTFATLSNKVKEGGGEEGDSSMENPVNTIDSIITTHEVVGAAPAKLIKDQGSVKENGELPCGEIEAAFEREAKEELEAGKAATGTDAITKYVEWAGDRYIMRPAQVDKLTFHIYFALQTALELHREKKTPFLSRQISLMCCLTSVIGCGNAEKVCTDLCKKYDI